MLGGVAKAPNSPLQVVEGVSNDWWAAEAPLGSLGFLGVGEGGLMILLAAELFQVSKLFFKFIN